MEALRAVPGVRLQVVVTGAHLAPEMGETWREIEAAGIGIDARVEMLVSGDTPTAVAKSLGLGTIGFADALARLAPDLLVLLGDRYEILAAAQTAMVLRIPIAHIHGGETTEGAIDEAIRHAITKMAHLHFVAAEPFRRRVIAMGEAPERVFTVGALGLDGIAKVDPMDEADLAGALGLELERPFLLVTYHPATLAENACAGAEALLAALESLSEGTVLFTGVNADADGRRIDRLIRDFVARDEDRRAYRASLGQRLYLNAMRHADVVVGNSSSGIIEAPSLGVPTVNLGARQEGRPRAPSVIDCAQTPQAIGAAIRRALDPAFKARAARRESPYGEPGASDRIARILADAPLDGLLMKRFHDHAGDAS